jgi:hypothetical protein
MALKRTSSSNSEANTSPLKSTFRQSTLHMGVTQQKKRSAIGAASNHGRLFKVMGDLFLLAGRLEDAVVWLVLSPSVCLHPPNLREALDRYQEAVVLCKSLNDYVWHAGALEGQAVVSVVEAWSAGTASVSVLLVC